MFYTYILRAAKGTLYAGYSENLKNRINEHQAGKVFATKSKLPIELIYYEACLSKYDALKREKYFKSGPGKKYLKQRMKNFIGTPVAS